MVVEKQSVCSASLCTHLLDFFCMVYLLGGVPRVFKVTGNKTRWGCYPRNLRDSAYIKENKKGKTEMNVRIAIRQQRWDA